MRGVKICLFVMLAAFAWIGLHAQSTKKVTVVGTLGRAMAIGGESTGWSIQLDSEMTIDGKQVHSIEVDSPNKEKLEKLENKHVKATGVVSARHGVETGERQVLAISSIKESKAAGKAKPAKPEPAT